MCDREPSMRFVEAERRTRIHFEADKAAFGRAPEVDASKRQAQALGQANAPVMRLGIELDAFESGWRAGFPRGIAIVDGIARDGSRERAPPDHVNAYVDSRNPPLK